MVTRGLFQGKGGIIVCFSPKCRDSETTAWNLLVYHVHRALIEALVRASIRYTITSEGERAKFFEEKMSTLLFCPVLTGSSWAGIWRYGLRKTMEAF